MKFFKFFVVVTISLLASTASFGQSTNDHTSHSEETITISTKVKGITCSSDVKTIATNVEKLEGVSTCKAGKTGPTTSFEIVYNPALVSEEEIHAAIQNTGGCENPDDRPYKVK